MRIASSAKETTAHAVNALLECSKIECLCKAIVILTHIIIIISTITIVTAISIPFALTDSKLSHRFKVSASSSITPTFNKMARCSFYGRLLPSRADFKTFLLRQPCFFVFLHFAACSSFCFSATTCDHQIDIHSVFNFLLLEPSIVDIVLLLLFLLGTTKAGRRAVSGDEKNFELHFEPTTVVAVLVFVHLFPAEICRHGDDVRAPLPQHQSAKSVSLSLFFFFIFVSSAIFSRFFRPFFNSVCLSSIYFRSFSSPFSPFSSFSSSSLSLVFRVSAFPLSPSRPHSLSIIFCMHIRNCRDECAGLQTCSNIAYLFCRPVE